MNVEAREFDLGVYYQINDIIYVENIAQSNPEVSATDADPDPNLGILNEAFFKNTDLLISLDIKKSEDATSGFESFTEADSSGVGIEIEFNNGGSIQKLIPHGNVPISNFRRLNFIVKTEEIPEEATQISNIKAATFDISGTFYFKNINLEYLNKYFYCIQDNTSSDLNKPSGDDGEEFWTKSFLWRPDYGAKFSFSNDVRVKNFGDGYNRTYIQGLNSMRLSIAYSFSNLTTKKASAIIHFLQQVSELRSSSFTADDKGNPLSSSLIDYFNLELPFPYKQKLVTVEDFSHKENYINNHSLDISFICDKESILDNLESYKGFNSNLDIRSSFGDNPTSLSSNVEINMDLNDRLSASSPEKQGVLLKNYVKVNLNAFDQEANVVGITPDFDYQTIPPFNDMEIIFPFIIQANLNRSSIFIDDVGEIEYYPYDEVRSFTFSPDINFSINFKSLDKQITLENNYSLFVKNKMHSSLMSISLSFSRRSDQELKSILYFLESHLGYIPFRFKVPENYNKINENENFKKNIKRAFYCPKWTHSYNFKNNHSIKTDFIEYSLPV